MNYLPELRSSLVSAAERTADQPGGADHAAPAARPGTRRRHLIAGLRLVPFALGVVVAVGIAVLALALVHHRSAPHRSSAAAATLAQERKPLLEILGVLRRPQTPSDLDSTVLTRNLDVGSNPFEGSPDRALIRRATTTPWGSPVFLVPTRPVPAGRTKDVFGSHPPKTLVEAVTAPGERLSVVDASGSGGDSTAVAIEEGLAIGWSGAGHSFAGGSTQVRIIAIVPDGVAKVSFVFPRQVDRNDPGAPVYHHSLTATAPVHNNVVAIQVHRQCCARQVPMIWYAADGHVLKEFGSLNAANRVYPSPKVGPETPQSRAAERNPSTPNRVWVTPATGGPHAAYLIHFRVLLNDADYSYTFTGPRCPGLTLSGGQGGGPDDIRGHVFTGVPGGHVPRGGWCPGTYRVSVRVTDLGRAGNLRHPDHPFGSATFVVKR